MIENRTQDIIKSLKEIEKVSGFGEVIVTVQNGKVTCIKTSTTQTFKSNSKTE